MRRPGEHEMRRYLVSILAIISLAFSAAVTAGDYQDGRDAYDVGDFDTAMRLVSEVCERASIYLLNSINPFRIEGQQSAAWEITAALGEEPAVHALPVGNAGNITAYWKGYKEYHAHGKCDKLPKMMGWQASEAAPIVHGKPVVILVVGI